MRPQLYILYHYKITDFLHYECDVKKAKSLTNIIWLSALTMNNAVFCRSHQIVVLEPFLTPVLKTTVLLTHQFKCYWLWRLHVGSNESQSIVSLLHSVLFLPVSFTSITLVQNKQHCSFWWGRLGLNGVSTLLTFLCAHCWRPAELTASHMSITADCFLLQPYHPTGPDVMCHIKVTQLE